MLTQKKLAQLIMDLWTMSASMNAAAGTNELRYHNGVAYAPVKPEWLEKAGESLQNAAEDLEDLLDDTTPVERPPSKPILALVEPD